MRVGSVFSGIGGFDLGLERAGHEIVFQCEADPFRRAVLEERWPGVPVYEDVVRLRESAQRAAADGVLATTDEGRRQAWAGLPSSVDLLCGGFPCQDLSVAGRRAGLDGARSGLFFEFAQLAAVLVGGGGWVLIENVPGLFSSPGRDRKGADFAVLLATLANIGFHDLAWRVLDSRFFGVPQRRRRVFILARRSRGRRACEVLLEPEGSGRDSEASGEAQEEVAGTLGGGSGSRGWCSDTDRTTFIPTEPADQSKALKNTSGGTSKGSDHDTYVVSKALTARERWDGETETFIPTGDDGRGVRRRGQSDADDSVREGVEQPRPSGWSPDLADTLTKGSARSPGVNPPGRRKEDDVNLVAHTHCDPHAADDEDRGIGDGRRDGTGSSADRQPHAASERPEQQRPSLRGEDACVPEGGQGPPPDPDRVREASGLPGRVDGDPVEEAPQGEDVGVFDPSSGGPSSDPDTVASLRSGGARSAGGTHPQGSTGFAGDTVPVVYPKVHAVHATQDPSSEEGFTPALGGGATGNAFIGHNGRGQDGDRCSIDPAPDGRRYAACGDAVSVPVIEWIGSRLPL